MANRLDAPVHLSDGVMAKRLIKSSPYGYMPIGDVSSRIWHAGRWKRVYVTKRENGITLLGSSAILKSNLEDEKLISSKYTYDIEDKKLKKGWILISCSGTIGNCAFTNAQHAETRCHIRIFGIQIWILNAYTKYIWFCHTTY